MRSTGRRGGNENKRCHYYIGGNAGCQGGKVLATLYELDAKIRDFPFEVDPDTGEVLNIEALDALEMERNQKLENIACFYKNVTADAAAIKAEEAALKKRREALERTAERLKDYLLGSLNGKKFSSPRAAVTFRRTERVDVENAELAIATLKNGGYEEALRYKPPEIVKTEVKRLLKDGVELAGIQLKETLSATIK